MDLRANHLAALDGNHFDVIVVGAGINGAASAAALASRDVRVAVVDRGDFASFTSQESSNLVWGGFKYLQNYEIGLVRKLCSSRNRLMGAYPSNIKQVGFLASLDESAPFPSWLACLGAYGYWGLGGFRTKRPRYMTASTIHRNEPVVNIEGVHRGIEYYDGHLKDNDARFVFVFVRDAIARGATAANYVEVTNAVRIDGQWLLTLTDTENNRRMQCSADYIVNAAGPFVDGLNTTWHNPTKQRIVYSKGIHLIVPRLTKQDRVLAFFDKTQRLFYVIPMGDRSVIGTTDTRTGSPYSAVTNDDRDFLLREINSHLRLNQPLSKSDIIAERCGVRPLVVDSGAGDHETVDWTTLSRRHEVHASASQHIVTVFGGKLTDCLNIGDEVSEALSDLGLDLELDRHDWYGEPSKSERKKFDQAVDRTQLANRRTASGSELIAERLWRRYGLDASGLIDLMADDHTMADTIFDGDDLLRAEVYAAAAGEMVTKLEDFLRRRTALSLVIRHDDLAAAPGLRAVAEILFGTAADQKLAEYLDSRAPAVAAPHSRETND